MNRREFLRSGVAATALYALPATLWGSPPTLFTGRVVNDADGSPLSGVLLSNGDDVTWSDAVGRFVLPAPAFVAGRAFVYIEPPGDRLAVGRWYREATAGGELTFRMRAAPTGRIRDRLRVLHLTDSHIAAAARPHYVSPDEWRTDLLQAVEREVPDVVVITGDLTDLGLRDDLEAFAATLEDLPVPVLPLFAGHDGLQEYRDRTNDYEPMCRHYETVLGPLQQSFRLGPWYFVLYPEPFGFPAEQRRTIDRWFGRVLAAAGDASRIVLVTHDPTTWHPEGKAEVYGPSLRDFPAGRKPELILNGQYHGTRVFRHDGTTIVGAPSSSMGGIDASPRGYAVIDLAAGQAPAVRVEPFRARAVVPGLAPSRRRWRARLPHGVHGAAPVAAGGLVLFNVSDFGGATPGLTALDAASGAQRWQLETPAVVKHAVVVDAAGEHGYAVTVAGTALAFDVATGRIRWAQTLPNHPDRWLYIRPVLHGNRLILSQDSARLALRVADGAVEWRHGRQWENAWQLMSPAPILRGDRWHVLVPNSLGGLAFVCGDANTGEERWRTALTAPPRDYGRLYQLQFASPVEAGDDLLVPGLGDNLLALNASDGAVRWMSTVARRQGPAACTCISTYHTAAEFFTGLTTAGDRVLTTTAHGRIAAAALDDGRELWARDVGRAPLIDCVPYYRGGRALLTPPLVVGNRVIFGGTDGWLREHAVDDGRELAAHDFGAPLTAPPIHVDGELVVVTFDGDVERMAGA